MICQSSFEILLEIKISNKDDLAVFCILHKSSFSHRTYKFSHMSFLNSYPIYWQSFLFQAVLNAIVNSWGKICLIILRNNATT